jgi:hypothetical protein
MSVDKRAYYEKFAHVSVNGSIWSEDAKCHKCKTNKQEFSVFLGEGQRLSTLYSTCCSECLPSIIKKAIEEGKEDAEKAIKNAEEREFLKDVEKYNL